MRFITITCLLWPLCMFAGDTVYLRSPNGPSCTIVNATNTTPVVITCAKPHGWAPGQAVIIYNVHGNYAANGVRRIKNDVNFAASSFAIQDAYSSADVAGSGPWSPDGGAVKPATPTAAPATLYDLRDHPRLIFDGPGGPLTTSLSSVTGRYSPDSIGRAALDEVYDTQIETYQSRTDFNAGTYCSLAEHWVANGSNSGNDRDFTAAKWVVTHPQLMGRIADNGGLYCNESPDVGQCGNIAFTDFVSLESWDALLAYELVYTALSGAERQQFADFFLNDKSLQHNGLGLQDSPGKDCTPVGSDGVWFAGSNHCGIVYIEKHHSGAPFSDPDSYGGGFEGDEITNNGGYTKTAAYFAQGLAFCGFDRRGCILASMAHAYWYDRIFTHQTASWGTCNVTDSYCRGRENWMANYMALVLRNSVPGYPGTYGNGIRDLLYQYIFFSLPYDTSKVDHWGTESHGNSVDEVGGVGSVLYTAAAYPDDPAAGYGIYWLTNTFPWLNASNLGAGSGWGLCGWYPAYNPAIAPRDYRGAIPSQYWFHPRDQQLCSSFGLDCSSAPLAIPLVNIISRTGLSSASDTLLHVNVRQPGGDARNSYGAQGNIHIWKNAPLMVGDANVPGDAGSGYEIWDNMIEVGGTPENQLNNEGIGRCYGQPREHVARWAGADPTGDPQSRFMYVLVDNTDSFCPGLVNRVHKHVLHLKSPGKQDYVLSYVDFSAPAPVAVREFLHFWTGGAQTVTLSRQARTVSNVRGANSRLNAAVLFPGSQGYVDTENHSDSDGRFPSSWGNSFRVSVGGGSSIGSAVSSAEWINVYQPASSSSATMPPITQPPAGGFRAVQIADATSPKVAAFAVGGQTYSSVSFTTNHGGTAQYLIAGLDAGRYIVTLGSSDLGTFDVNEGDNTLYFEGVSGSYRITKQQQGDPGPTLTGLSCAPTTLSSGGSATCTISLSGSVAGAAASVGISNNSSALTAPGSVTVALGASAATFNVTAASIPVSHTATLTATYNGVSQSASIALLAPAPPPAVVAVSSLSCSDLNLQSGAVATCTVTLTGQAPAEGIAVSLNADGQAISAPLSVTVNGGNSSVEFSVTAGSASSSTTVTLIASAGGASRSVSITVLPAISGCALPVRCVGPGKQYSNLQDAADAAQPGDTVLVFDGSYAGFRTVRSGSGAAPITFKSYSPNVFINSRNSRTPDNINIENTDYIVVDGFNVQNAPRAGIRVAESVGVVIRNNAVTGSAMWGIFTGFAPAVKIINNKISATVGQHGIYVSNSSTADDNPVISGNESYGNAQNGVQVNGDCETSDSNGHTDGVISGAVLENNNVHDNGYKGFSLISMQDSLVRNNLLYNNGRYGGAAGIHLADQSGCGRPSSRNVIVNNTVVEPSIAGLRLNDGSSSNVIFNNLVVAPGGVIDEVGGNNIDSASNVQAGSTSGLFVSPGAGDYHLAPGSRAIDAGKATYAGRSAPATDFAGVARPQGPAYDAGAFESPHDQTCNLDISPSGADYSANGGTGSVVVSVPAGCSWSASANAPWIRIVSGSNGNGSGSVAYSVTVNTGRSKRANTITVAGRNFQVRQAEGVPFRMPRRF